MTGNEALLTENMESQSTKKLHLPESHWELFAKLVHLPLTRRFRLTEKVSWVLLCQIHVREAGGTARAAQASHARNGHERIACGADLRRYSPAQQADKTAPTNNQHGI